MTSEKIIFVTGGTGKQGGAVALHLAKKGFIVKALTRNPGSVRARTLHEQGLQLVKGDLNNPESYREHLKGVYGVFSVQTFENGIKKELHQGISLAAMAKDLGIRHFIYSSIMGADLHSGVPHMENKYSIENHIQQIRLPFTIIRPASLYENFLIPQVKKGIEKGKLVQPVNKKTVLQYVAVDDIGRAVTKIFQQEYQFLGKIIPLAAEQLTTQEVAETFSAALNNSVLYQKLPGIVARLVLGKTVYKMFQWMNALNRFEIENLDRSRQLLPDALPLKVWIQNHFPQS